MKSVILKSVTIALLGCLICSTVFAADSATRWGAVQTDAIRRILSRKPFYSEQPEKPFCATLLKDFRELMDVHLVNPVAQAQNYDDSVLSSYKARCDGLPLNEYFTCEPGDIYGVEWSNDPKEQRKQWLKLCRRYVGTRTFRIFTLDINRELKGETVLIMYSERACRITADGVSNECMSGGYNVFNNQNCAQLGGMMTHDPYSYDWGWALKNYNGIFSYHGRYYFYDLYEFDVAARNADDSDYRLEARTIVSDPAHSCSYSTVMPILKSPTKQTKAGGSK